MDHSEENNHQDIVRTSLSEEAVCAAPSFFETFRIGNERGIDLKSLRAFCLAPNGLVSPEWRKAGWPKLVGAHVEIWRAAAKIPPMDNDECSETGDSSTSTSTHRLHHPSKDEITYIKQVVSSCEWESIGIHKEDAIVMPEHKPRRPSSSPTTGAENKNNGETSTRVERRVSFHLSELAFSTKRQKDRKTLRKVLIHLKRTNPNLAITSATCSAVAMVLSIVQSSSLSTLVVQQLVAYPWKYSREWPRSNNAWELDDKWQSLVKELAPEIVQHFETNDVDVLEGTIRYSWIPSWLSQNMRNKDLLARIWDVLVPSKPDSILYVCISLLVYFQKELLAEMDTDKIRAVLMDLPSKLNSTEKAEAVLSQAMEWMTKSVSDEIEVDIPTWVTATVAPADSAMVEYARHLRETVTERGKALVSDGRCGDKEEKDWFSVTMEDSKSRFVAAFKAKALKQKEEEARRSSNKSSWVLVLVLLLLAASVIVGVETDCSILLGTKRTTSSRSDCLHQISDLYLEDTMQYASQLQAMGHNLCDEIKQKMMELKMAYAPPDSSTVSDNGVVKGIQEEEAVESDPSDTVMSPSENLDDDQMVEATNEESSNEALENLSSSDITNNDVKALDESESSIDSEDDTTLDRIEPEASAPILEEPDRSPDSTIVDDHDTVESDGPVEQSRQDADRLMKETLHQAAEASKFAESLVSQFLEEAKHIAAGEVVEGAFSETTQESSGERQPEQSSDDHPVAAEDDFFDLDHDVAVGDSVVDSVSSNEDDHGGHLDQEIRAAMTTDEVSLTGTKVEDPKETDELSPEQEESSKQGSESPNGDYDEVLRYPVEDRIHMEGIEGGGEDFNDETTDMQAEEAEMTAQDQSDSPNSPVDTEESESTITLDDEGTKENWADEVSGDTTSDPRPISEHSLTKEHTIDEAMDDPVSDETDERMVEADDQAAEPEPTEESTVLGMAHGLLTRYLGYFGSEPHETILLSTPFYSKDDVAAVFEQLMASSMDEAPMQNWDKRSVEKMRTWESTVLI
ncbi:unnamed protein product [Cylindrotheca closterium]|uniref:Rab-GAP TBC domain-containing protein n=1 Tax=Cylindrotheca closterium TaxID=2856 RepID=A0AAD2JGK8_9STRA|nr:unnamed protein product [Cylindrotheca closterium]